jgi:tetratricopeptide (TPR) repeat protein
MALALQVAVHGADVVTDELGLPAREASLDFVASRRVRFLNTPIEARASKAVHDADWAEAARQYREALKNDPTNNRYRLSLIEIHRRLGQWEEGLLIWDELVREYPDNREVRQRRAVYGATAIEAALGAKRTDQLVERYRSALERDWNPLQAMDFHHEAGWLIKPEEDEALLKRVAGTPNVEPAVRRRAEKERAFLLLRQNRLSEAAQLTAQLDAEQPEGTLVHAVAQRFVAAGDATNAIRWLDRSLEADTNKASRISSCRMLAALHMELKHREQARQRYAEARRLGPPDRTALVGEALANYELGRYEDAADLFLSVPDPDEPVHALSGYSLARCGHPGPALHELEKIRDWTRLPVTDQRPFLANRGFLRFGEDRYQAAVEDFDAALAIEPTPDIRMAKARTLVHAARFDDAKDLVLRLMEDPAVREKSEPHETLGLALMGMGRNEDAIEAFDAALDRQPGAPNLLYSRGVAKSRAGQLKEACKDWDLLCEKTTQPPLGVWGNRGLAQGVLGEYTNGIPDLQRSLGYYRHDLATWKDLGHQARWAASNQLSKAAFARASDFYEVVMPYLGSDEARAYRKYQLDAKAEYTKLDKTFGLQAYVVRTDYGFDKQNDPGFATTLNPLPSQLGLEAAWRPPVIGFRNERTCEVFGRLLASFEENSWRPRSETWQGGIGLRYKPFISQNLNISIERLIKIGDAAEDNWLWRNMISLENGGGRDQGRLLLLLLQLYGEWSLYLEPPRRWIGFVEGKAGPTLQVGGGRLRLTLPQIKGVFRYQSDDPEGIGSYQMVGLGGTLRLYDGEQEYTRSRCYGDLFAHYTWGWFTDRPVSLNEDRSFEGWVMGISFVK